MSDVAFETGNTDDTQLLWRNRIRAAEYHRRPFELGWLTSLAFVAGQQWTVVDRHTRTLRDIREVDPRYENADLYVADIITEQRAAALGELQSDSDRPELLIPADAASSNTTEDIQRQVNRAIGHGWDFEWDGDGILADVDRKTVDMGVAAVRCRFDKTAGNAVEHEGQQIQYPVGDDGQAITDASKARDYVAGLAGSGKTAKFQDAKEGAIRWETGSAFNLLVPPGVPHEKDFPWEIWVRPAPLDEVNEMYPGAADLVADQNIGSVLGITISQGSTSSTTNGQLPARLADHVWLYTCYEKPTRKYPKGRVAVLAGGAKKLLQVTPQLPYKMIDGTWHSGIVYFHWWRLTDRFWSRSLIETLKDPQRMTNRTATAQQEIIDRGMPYILVEEGAVPEKPSGRPVEWVEVKKGTQVPPQPVAGIGPGPWMTDHRNQLMSDAQHASTLSGLKLGENPTNVDTYAQYAAMQDQEAAKRSTIRSDRQHAISLAVQLSLQDIQRMWPERKQIMVAGGSENELQVSSFEKNLIPPLYLVRPAKGSAAPRNQASQLQLVADIWAAATASLAVQQNPIEWVKWLKSSYEAGEPLELPEPPTDHQAEKAERENDEMFAGESPAVAYWDPIQTHLPIHRDAQEKAIEAGDVATLQIIEQHIQEHLQVAAANAQQVAQEAPPSPPLPPGPGAPLPSAVPPALAA